VTRCSADRKIGPNYKAENFVS